MNEKTTKGKQNGRSSNCGKSKGNSKPKYNSRRSKGGKPMDVDPRNVGDINDASYYFTDDLVMSQLTNISFNEFLGVPVDLGEIHLEAADEGKISIPTFMQITLSPTAGGNDPDYGNGSVNGINTAARQMFLKLSAGNMKSTEYGPEDVGLAMLAIGSMLEMYSYIKRVFGSYRLFNQRNREIPAELLKVMNIDPDDFMDNAANYRARFNYLVTLANQIPFAANIPYFHKCVGLFDHLYVDSIDTPLAQLYVTMPETYWVFTDTYSEAGSGLTTKGFRWEGSEEWIGQPLSGILDKFEEQILALVHSTALLKVYSDILRLADKEGLVRLSIATIPDDYAILPVYNEEFNLMLKNATMTGPVLGKSYPLFPDDAEWSSEYAPTPWNDVKGDASTGTIIYRPAFMSQKNTMASVPEKVILNFLKQNPTAADIVEATRFTVMPTKWFKSDDPNSPGLFTTFASLPDHIITSIKIYDKANDIRRVINTSVKLMHDTDGQNFPHEAALLSQFESHPYIYGCNITVVNGVDRNYTFLFGDTEYYTTVDYKYLQKVNDFAMLGLFTLR